MKKHKLLFLVLMLALVVSTIAGILGTVAASPVSSPAAAVVTHPNTGNASSVQQALPDPNKVVDGVLCSRVHELGIDKQMNLHAGRIMIACGLDSGPLTDSGQVTGNIAAPANYGGTDVNVVTGAETLPHVTQSESMVWEHGTTIVVNYNDSIAAPSCYSGTSVSTDGGATFTRLGSGSGPLCTGHGNNYGDPNVVYDNALNTWIAADLAAGCGGQGIGIWSSADGSTWAATSPGCAMSSSQGDRNSMWVDNNSTSPHYGRIYVSFNDFNVGGGALQVTHSDDGANWSAPVTVFGSFRRDVQLTGSQGSDGSVYLAAMDEMGGGVGNRQNYMYKSINGGASFTQIYAGPVFAGPGSSLCSGSAYFTKINPIWRYMGIGQPAATGTGIIGYDYTQRDGSDDGNIYFVRSTNSGATWSTPVKLNSDSTTHEQWMPSLAASVSGALIASWYDRRDTTDGTNYKFYARLSLNGGATWQADAPVSDVLSTQPQQPDPNVQACYVGDYNYHSVSGSTALITWTDGRNAISGTPQQDVYFDKVDISGNPATPTPIPSPTVTPIPPTPQPTVCANPFVDIASNIFFHAINYLYCNHAVNGTDASHYTPAGTASRGQFAKVVVLGFGETFYTPPGGSQDFTDVPPSYFAYSFIETGFHNGILSGFDPAGCTAHGATYPCYLPNLPITRGQLTKLVVGAAHYPPFTPAGGQTFSDVPASNVFFVSIETAHHKGVINGYPDSTFRPNNNIRRDEMAQIVYKGVTTP